MKEQTKEILKGLARGSLVVIGYIGANVLIHQVSSLRKPREGPSLDLPESQDTLSLSEMENWL